jgi:hypothetical protein
MLPRLIVAKCSLYAHFYTDEGKPEGGPNMAVKKNILIKVKLSL